MNEKSETNQNLRPLLPLSEKERRILEFIESYFLEHSTAPTFQEIKDHFQFASFNSVQRYVQQLKQKGYIYAPGGNSKRAITVLHSSNELKMALDRARENKVTEMNLASNTSFSPTTDTKGSPTSRQALPAREVLEIPLLGKVAAGVPLEEMNFDETIHLPPSLGVNKEKCFALKVKGLSMIDEGILDGDVIVVKSAAHAKNGDLVVATVQNESTVKRFYLHQGAKLARPQVELRPANATLESQWYSPDELKISGIVVGLLRKF